MTRRQPAEQPAADDYPVPQTGDLAFTVDDYPVRVLDVMTFSDGTLAARIDYPNGTTDVVNASDLLSCTHDEWRTDWQWARRAPFRRADAGLERVIGWMRPPWPGFSLSVWGTQKAESR